MIISNLVAIGFLGSIFGMFRFGKYCRLLNNRNLEPEEAERYQARAQRWLAAVGCLLGVTVLTLIVGGIIDSTNNYTIVWSFFAGVCFLGVLIGCAFRAARKTA